MWHVFPDVFLPRTSPWKKAFVGTLVVLPLSLVALAVLALRYFYKQRRFQGMSQAVKLVLLHSLGRGLDGVHFPCQLKN